MKLRLLALTSTVCLGMLAPQAHAQTSDWQFRASLYGYFPSISGDADFRFASTGINVDPHDIIPNLNFVFMGAFEAQKSRWGAFTDLIYVDFSDAVAGFRKFTLGGGLALPAGVNINANLGIKMTMWTLAGEYRIYKSPDASVDVLAGARNNDTKGKLGFLFNVDLGPFSGPNRQGELGSSFNNWDGIIGMKGRKRFGSEHKWFATGYGDMGTGDSDFTWQALAGLGYTFGKNWDVTAGWRHIAYDLSSSSTIKRLDYDGPLIGVSFNW